MTVAEHFDPADDLDAFLAGEEPDWEADPEPPPNQHEADKMLARIARLRGQRERSREAAEERMRQIVGWQAEREGVWLRQEEWLLSALGRYHAAVLELNPKALTIHLPSGDLVSRRGQPNWTVVDEGMVIDSIVGARAWARVDALRAEFLAAVGEVLREAVSVEEAVAAVKVAPPGPLAVSKSGLKSYGTIRDEKKRPVKYGVTPTGEPIPGITITPAERDYDVVLRVAEPAHEWDDYDEVVPAEIVEDDGE